MPENPQLPVPSEGESKVDLFRRKEVRKTLHNNEWWFAIKDIVESLVDTPDGTHYIRTIRSRDQGLQEWWAQNVLTLPFESNSGIQNTNFTTVEGVFRLLQSIPSQKAEPFKRWLAKNAFERLQEIESPELAVKRAITLYRAKGYDDEWIDARIRNKASREILTAEWSKRGMNDNIAILTDAISVETFGLGIQRHKQVKGLAKHHNLRDNMTPIELTLTTLGEQATTAISKANNPVTLQQNYNVARQGGAIAGGARKEIEQATGEKVISPKNYLTPKQRENSRKEFQQFDDILKRLLDVPPIQNKDLKTGS